MATQADIDALSDKLSTARPLSWVIADCPVVALFKNHSAEGLGSLGQPLDRNGCGDLLRLWVGINEDADELFVTLTIRIRVSPVRKKTRRQGRLMFMVVPCNALQLQSAVVDYNDLGNKLSQYLFDMPSDTQSAKSKLLNISFDLGPHTSDVIMPAFQCRSNVMPQAMTLLRKLKSLSETSSFQLYTNLDESRLVAVQRVSNMLLNGHPIITPSLDTKGFYPGGRSACKNMWADQGWLEAGDKDTPGKESEVEKNQKELHIPFDPQPPPPYEPNSVPNHVPASPGPCGSPSLPRTTVNVSEQGLPATAPPNDSTPVRSVSQHHPQQLRAAKSDIAPPGVDRAFSRARNSPPSTSETSLSSDYTSTFLSGFPSQSPLPQIRDRLAAQIRAVATSSPFPSVQVAVSSAAERALDNDNVSTRVNTPTRIVDCVPDSTSRKRQPSYSLGANDITKRPTLSRQNHQLLLFDDLQAGFSPTIPDTISCYNEDTTHPVMKDSVSTDQKDQLMYWLNHAWHYCPTAHYLFVTELLSYGSALSSNRSQDEIATCHVNCTVALISHCTKRMLTEELNYAGPVCEVDAETRTLARWLYVLRPGVDMELFSSLLRLSVLSQRLLLVSRTSEHHDALAASFRRQKAEIALLRTIYTAFDSTFCYSPTHTLIMEDEVETHDAPDAPLYFAPVPTPELDLDTQLGLDYLEETLVIRPSLGEKCKTVDITNHENHLTPDVIREGGDDWIDFYWTMVDLVIPGEKTLLDPRDSVIGDVTTPWINANFNAKIFVTNFFDPRNDVPQYDINSDEFQAWLLEWRSAARVQHYGPGESEGNAVPTRDEIAAYKNQRERHLLNLVHTFGIRTCVHYEVFIMWNFNATAADSKCTSPRVSASNIRLLFDVVDAFPPEHLDRLELHFVFKDVRQGRYTHVAKSKRQIEERHLERIFANYKPRDISIERLINAPPWIEQVGQNSRIYRLFWKNVPLIIPAETYLDPPAHLTGNIAQGLARLGVETLSDISWNNVDNFINRYFLTPGSSWCDEDTFPRIDEDSIAAFLGTFEKLRCMHQYYRRRLTPIFIWKDARGDRMYSKQPNNKRNILPGLGISQPMQAILEEALDMWADFLTGRLDTYMDQDEMHDHLSLFVRDHIEALYKDEAEKRGYMKYWMTRAFDCFSRPEMGMDRDMWSWAALNDGSLIQPRYNFLLPEDSNEDMEEDEVDEEVEEGGEEMDEEVGEGDEEMDEDLEDEEDDVEGYEEERDIDDEEYDD
ncbi:hypothetical protein KCU98_g1567, partial [Aureobasidium melanogenum]